MDYDYDTDSNSILITFKIVNKKLAKIKIVNSDEDDESDEVSKDLKVPRF